MNELLKLAKRCEKATAGSRELDAEIAEALLIVDNCFTASIDAAMILIPKGASWNLQGNTSIFYATVANCPAAGHFPALALSAAALRAKASTMVHHATEQSSTPIGHPAEE